MSDYAEQSARLQVENEQLRAERDLLLQQVSRLTAVQHTLTARLQLAEADSDRLNTFAAAVQDSRAWRAIQALRGAMGRKW